MTAIGGSDEGLVSTAFFGPSEPNWAKQVQARKLAGILNLTCLLSSVTYISDNDVADNSNFFESFRDNDGTGPRLYRRLREFVEMGLVRIMLRDQSYRVHSQIDIGSFSDVFTAWQLQDPTNAWILQDFGDERKRYFADLDTWAKGSSVARYPYRGVKELFMANIRSESASRESALSVAVRQLPVVVQTKYYDLLQHDWFSLTDINTLLQDGHVPADHPAMLYHGMANQVAFSAHKGSSLLGVDRFRIGPQGTGDPVPVKRSVRIEQMNLHAVLDRANDVLDGPSLVTLACLSPAEIGQLRSLGKSYFDLMDMSHDPEYWSKEQGLFGSRLLYAAVEYWGQVCEYLRSHHRGAVERPTKLAMFLGYDANDASVFKDAVSVVLEAGVSSAASSAGGASMGSAAKGLMGLVSLRFLFVTPVDEFVRIRSVLPKSSWFRRSRPGVLDPP